MTTQDAPFQIGQLTSRPARRALNVILDQSIPDADGLATSKRFIDDLDTVMLTATVNGTVVGGIIGNSPAPFINKQRKLNRHDQATRVITQVAVAPEFRGQTIGRELVRAAEQQFRASGASVCVIEVDDRSPDETHEFWKRMGYEFAMHARQGQPIMSPPPGMETFLGFVPMVRSGTYYLRYLNVDHGQGAA